MVDCGKHLSRSLSIGLSVLRSRSSAFLLGSGEQGHSSQNQRGEMSGGEDARQGHG